MRFVAWALIFLALNLLSIVPTSLAAAANEQSATTQSGQRPVDPCAQPADSLPALKRAFNRGRIPTPAEITGSWVAVGFFGDARSHGKTIRRINCIGLQRGALFEQVMLAKGYSVEMHVIGTCVQRAMLEPDRRGGLAFPFDFGGDASPVYRCRFTERKTLACLIDVYREGVEFRRLAVRPDQIP